jgi:hypothetical protein
MLSDGCLVTIVSVTKVVCEGYLTIMVTMYMILIRKIKGDRYDWKVEMTLISYSRLDS